MDLGHHEGVRNSLKSKIHVGDSALEANNKEYLLLYLNFLFSATNLYKSYMESWF
jgi:hypothetical protein